MTKPLRALLIEDSPVQARALQRVLEAEGDIVVIACANSGPAALEEVLRHRPDVVTLDLDVPRDGGQRAIEQIMADAPTPILVLSGLVAEDGGKHAVAALAAGAVDALPKPDQWTEQTAADLRRQVRRVGAVPVIRRRAQPRPPRASVAKRAPTDRAVVAVAASTGGPAALTALLSSLGGLPAPILVVQHIHASFASGFAAWLQEASGRPVKIVSHGERAQPGLVYVGPGEQHLRLGPRRTLVLSPDPPSLHRPSADELFASVAQEAGRAGIGVILTGMGEDGARGLAALRAVGGTVLAQDQASSAVFGMPLAAHRAGATDRLLPLPEIADAVRDAVEAVA